MKALRLLAAAAVAGVLSIGPLQASSIIYTSFSEIEGGYVNITTPGIGGVSAGQIQLNTSGGPIMAWCMDLLHWLQPADTMTLSPLTTGGPNNLNMPSLTTGQVNQMGSLMFFGSDLMASSHAAETSAALQLSIWRVEYTNLAYSTSAAIQALSDVFIANLSTIWNCPTCSAQQLVGSSYNQVLGFGVRPELTSVVPIPAAAWLFATGLAGLGVIARRRRKSVALTVVPV